MMADRIKRAWAVLRHGRDTKHEELQHAVESVGMDLTSAKMEAAGILRDNIRLKEQLRDEIERLTSLLQPILDKASRTRWDERPHGEYSVSVMFDPRLPGLGFNDRSSREVLAELVASKVRREIITAHFIQAAEEQERRYHHLDASPFPPYGGACGSARRTS